MTVTGKTLAYYRDQAAEWAFSQAEYLDNSTELLLLVHLARCALHFENNLEGAPIGQVMYGESSQAKIQNRTRLSDDTVRKYLSSLQDKGYIRVLKRYRNGSQEPLNIQVLWWEGTLQEQLRELKTTEKTARKKAS